MKKIISLILSIAMLATLMPTMFAGAADTVETVTVGITEDTFLYPNNNSSVPGGYGEEVYGDVTELQLADCKNAAADNRHILMKAPLSSLSLDSNQAITKVELVINRVYNSGLHNSLNYSNLNVYNTSSDWSESTTCLNHWNDTKTDVYQGHLPSIYYDSTVKKYMAIDATPDAIYSGALPKVEEANPYAQITLDVTSVFKKAFPSGQIGTDSELSMLIEWNYNDAYQVMAVASSEHATEVIRPKLVFTIDTIPTLELSSVKLPEMVDDDFTINLSNNINSAVVNVNSIPIDASALTINGATLKLDYEYQGLTEYDVSVDITDIYGQKFTQTYNFTTRDANGADASGIIKKYITEDTSLCVGNIAGKYGEYVAGNDTTLRWRARNSADGAYLLYKIPTGSITVPSNMTITKVELNLTANYEPSSEFTYSAGYSGAPVAFYNASSNWDESTYMYEWCPDKTTTPSITHTPQITWYTAENGYALIGADPVINASVDLSALTVDNPTQNITFDITAAYKNATLDGNGDFSVIAQLGTTAFYRTGVASAENTNASLRPYITVTLADKTKGNIAATEFYRYSVANPNATAMAGDQWVYTTYDKTSIGNSGALNYNSNSAILMRFDLTQNYYDSFNVTYKAASNLGYQTIYKFDNDSDKSAIELTYNDLDAVMYDGDNLDKTNLIGYVSAVGDTNVATIDVADYANECVANGKDYMCLIIATDGNSCKVGSDTPAAATVKPLETSITLKSSAPAVAGSYIKSIGAKFNTVLNNNAATLVELHKGAVKVEDVEFVSKGNTIDFATATKLEENTSYKVVLKAGATDLFGHTTTEDIEIASFTTGYDFVNHGIKILAADAEYDNDSFAAHTALTSTQAGATICAYWRADNNAMTEKSLIIAIAAYNADNELVDVQFSSFNANDEESKVYRTIDITVPATANTIKAFGWDGTSQANLADFVVIPVQ